MIYLHVPFCRSFCTYCGFYSEVAPKPRAARESARQEALMDEYVSAVCAEIEYRRHDIERVFASGDVNTLYVGGGTPSVLPLDSFRRVLEALGRRGFREFTVEVNPEDIVEKGVAYVEGLLELGVNRISMGVQSLDDGILRFMNRRHSSSVAVEAYRILEQAGVDNISIDLIFGLPQLTESLWNGTLDKVLEDMSPAHISAYQLSVEPGSMLEKMIAKGKWEEASDELCRKQYDVLCERLGAAGYHHYEISNFARSGFEAVHNSAYWRHVPYVGLGPGAHSYLTDTSGRGVPVDTFTPPVSMLQACRTGAAGGVVRQWNKDSLKEYLKAGQTGDFSAVSDGEVLDDGQLALEKVMLGLRTSAGLPETVLRECCSAGAVDGALASGDLVTGGDGHLRIPEDRFFISDSIILNMAGA